MRLLCKINTGKALRQQPFSPAYFAAFRGETDETIFHVVIGKEYPVFAMAAWKSVLNVLVLDETQKPNWYSIELFSVADGRLPQDWSFSNTIAKEHGVEAIWGYEAMVSDPTHYAALIERDSRALAVFHEERHKSEMNQ
jgi:hypothetical protein